MKKLSTYLLLMFCTYLSWSQTTGHIKIYFNRPVNNSVSSGENAVYLNNTFDDTLIAYINRAKSSIDVAVYNYNQSGSISNIATAINNAFSHGKVIRWIYDGSSTNAGLSSLNGNIPKLGSPTGSSYGIMHNKFIIIDANSSTASDAVVWTGSSNWNEGQFNSDVNNVVIIQDQAVAQAYTSEFNEMWGGTGSTPNTSNSKFGPDKTDNTAHTFTIDGKALELYFSPSDGTNNHILSSINSANSQIFFGIYTFTNSTDANAIKTKIQSGSVYCAGIMDSYSQQYSPYTTLNPVMGNKLKIYSQSGSIYHNKFVIIDACNITSDPQVLTGSHNWTVSADTKNDENTVIIHDATTANIFYQSFYQNFYDLGGTLNPCASEIAKEDLQNEPDILVFPNPANNFVTIRNLQNYNSNISIFDMMGKLIFKGKINANTQVNADANGWNNGIYMILSNSDRKSSSYKLFIQH